VTTRADYSNFPDRTNREDVQIVEIAIGQHFGKIAVDIGQWLWADAQDAQRRRLEAPGTGRAYGKMIVEHWTCLRQRRLAFSGEMLMARFNVRCANL
jgi:hypothetical protein